VVAPVHRKGRPGSELEARLSAGLFPGRFLEAAGIYDRQARHFAEIENAFDGEYLDALIAAIVGTTWKPIDIACKLTH
jgi:hypothetical protein